MDLSIIICLAVMAIVCLVLLIQLKTIMPRCRHRHSGSHDHHHHHHHHDPAVTLSSEREMLFIPGDTIPSPRPSRPDYNSDDL